MKTIAFHTPNLNFRGSCVALYDYADYNEMLLGNRSIIITDYKEKDTNDTIAFQWISSRFPIFSYSNLQELEEILTKTYCDLLYTIKYGKNDGIYSSKVKTVVHCVFDMSEPHGNVYAGVSKSLARKFDSDTFVPHMIRPPRGVDGDLRQSLNIPREAIVFGRHGGLDTFNLEFAKACISNIVRYTSNVYFVFMNAPEWDTHPQIIYLLPTTDRQQKQLYINTCDAMIVPETMGHSFGMSVAEFSISNKPVICYNGPVWNTSHIDILGSKGIYFSTYGQLYQILTTFKREDYTGKDWNAYRDYKPEIVMKIFENIFIK